MAKKIGIVGSGIVAQTLGSGFLKHGFDVMLGTRDAAKLQDWQGQNKAGEVGTFAEASGFGDIVVISVKGNVAVEVCKSIAEHLSGKTVIDTNNPLGDQPPQNGVLSFFTGPNESLLEMLQAAVAAAHFVKAFSCVGSGLMIDPDLPGGPPTMFICGNNDDAKKEVIELLEKVGWEASHMGKAESARAIEPLCVLWCIPGIDAGKWNHAFKLLHNY